MTAQVAGEASRLLVVDSVTGARTTLAGPPRRRPAWSGDGRWLACLEPAGPGRERPVVLDPATGRGHGRSCPDLDGTVEHLAWSPAAERLLLLVAEAGAELSDVYGSGRVPAAAELPDWLPAVATAGSGRRWLAVWEPGTGELTRVPLDRNVWEAAWAGPTAFCAVTSPAAHEDDWYDAQLTLLGADGRSRQVALGPGQVALPRATPSGSVVSVVAGRASDRDLVAGVLHLVDVRTAAVRVIDVPDVHVTGHRWRDEHTLVVVGLRGTASVVAELDRRTGVVTELFATAEAVGPGDLLPTAVPLGTHAVALVLEGAGRPPEVCVVTGGQARPVVSTQDGARARPGPAELSWDSSDGTVVQGLLHLPDGPARGLVVMVHGGPVWCWRNTWPTRVPQLSLLLGSGFAVLLPNPRGSQGRGEPFTAAIVGEVGGRDADDVLAGIDAVLAGGVVRADRVAVMGSSYGGFLAAWLATRPGRFAAAVAVSPATDWVSQHFTTNIPASDVRFLVGDPLDPTSQYVTRSPVRSVTAAAAPTLLTAGLLDLATPAGQAVEFHRALVEQGVGSDLALYPLEGHDVHGPEAALDHAARVLLWLEHHLPRA